MANIIWALIWEVVALCLIIRDNVGHSSSLITHNFWDQHFGLLILLILPEYIFIHLSFMPIAAMVVWRSHCCSRGGLCHSSQIWVDPLILVIFVLFSLIISHLDHVIMSLIFKILKKIWLNLNIVDSAVFMRNSVQILAHTGSSIWVQLGKIAARLPFISNLELFMVCIERLTLN